MLDSIIDIIRQVVQKLGVLSSLDSLIGPDAPQGIKDAVKKIREYLVTAAEFIEIEVETLSLSVLSARIKEHYFFNDNNFSGIAVVKEDDKNRLACCFISSNAPKIDAKCPLLFISYKTISDDLNKAFGDKKIIIIK